MADLTPFQTVGPYFALIPGITSTDPSVRDPGSGGPDEGGPPVVVTGMVRDGAGAPVPDALLEAWHPGLGRIVRAPTGPAGEFEFQLLRPTASADEAFDAPLAPALLVGVLARGILTRLVTRIYFGDDPANDADPILALVPASRRATLIAAPDGPGRFRLDLVLQGSGETVFFDV